MNNVTPIARNNRFAVMLEIDVNKLRGLSAEQQDGARQKTPPQSAPESGGQERNAVGWLLAAAADVVAKILEPAQAANDPGRRGAVVRWVLVVGGWVLGVFRGLFP